MADSCLIAIGLGSSLGDRRATLENAVRKLAAGPGMSLVRTSRWIRTPPLRGGSARNWFMNGVALFRTTLLPIEVLDRCVALEAVAGRRRVRFWGDRPLDIDILLVEGQVVRTGRLVLPHHAITARPFTLGPLLEVWPDAVDPATGTAYADFPPPPGPSPFPVGILARRTPLRYL